jgi:hypothetical protein
VSQHISIRKISLDPQKKGFKKKDINRDEILEELKVEAADEKLRRYKSNWLQQLTRMNNNRMTKIMLNYRPNGRRRLGRTLERL